jgi:hypothetical protein
LLFNKCTLIIVEKDVLRYPTVKAKRQLIFTTTMKVRISGNSIRFRLRQSEVKRFQQTGEIKEVTAFGGAAADRLTFVLKEGVAAEFQVKYEANTVTVEAPQSVCTEWTQTELVGFEELIDTGKGETIKILVEKDFKCLDGSDTENEDAFPNPNLHC